MQEYNQKNETGPAQTEQQKPKRFTKRRIIAAVIILIVLCGLVATAWYLQQQKINHLTQEKNDLAASQNKTSADLKSEQELNTTLKLQIEELNENINSLKQPEQAKMTLAFNEAKYKPAPTNVESDTRTSEIVFVTITVTNTSETLDGYFSQSDLILKNNDNDNAYPLCLYSLISYSCNYGLSLPAGDTEILSQMIPAGESVRGIVGFYVPLGLSEASLSYQGTEFKIDIQES